jgi:phosphatidylglycerophosphatase A
LCLTALKETEALDTIREEIVVAAATGVYTGYIPFAPGTFGTVVAIPFCFLLSLLGPIWGALFLIGFFWGAVRIAGEAEEVFGKKDSGRIVIDEIVGFLVALFLIPWTAKSLVVGFVLFRFFDIFKPYPIRMLETRLPGGWGVVADDVLAGVYANVVLRCFLYLL